MKISIPSYLALEARQIEKAQAWFDRRNKQIDESKDLTNRATGMVEEECCTVSTLSWHIQESGICTMIWIEDDVTKTRCDLTIDDDNELVS